MKLMVISACLILSFLILFVSLSTFKQTKSDKVVWFVFDAYAIGLLYVAIKIIFGV